MQTVYFQGNPFNVYGTIPAVGEKAPGFKLVTKDLETITLADYSGRRVVLNVFPSLDTAVCAMSVRKFNKEAASLDNTTVIDVSMDLPFAQARFCAAEGIDNCVVASAFREPSFGQHYGLSIVDGPLAGLLSRAVIVIDTDGKVIYRQLVDEITNEPDYEAALSVLK